MGRLFHLVLLAVWATACGVAERRLAIVPALPSGCVEGAINEVRLEALGDFSPRPATVTSATPSGSAELALPAGTRAVALEGVAPGGGTAAFGRSGLLELDQLWGGQLAIAYGPPDGLCATRRLNYPRAGHSATLLRTGQVLIAGGVDAGGFAVPKLELYAPLADALGPAATFRVVDQNGSTVLDKRAALGHAAVLLADGSVLVSGGAQPMGGQPDGTASQVFYRFGPDGLALGAPGVLGSEPRAFHSATVLADGRVLLAGGCTFFRAGACESGEALASTTVYDPRAGTFTDGPALAAPRWQHDAVLLADGRVALVGGRREDGSEPPIELVSPAGVQADDGTDGGSQVSGVVAAGRAALLPTGALWAIGGGAQPSAEAGGLSTALEAAGTAVALPPLAEARAGHTVTALDDGSVLVAGGGAGLPLARYDGGGRLHVLAARFGRTRHSATRLADGTVLLAGGDLGAGATTDAFLYLRSPLGPWSNLPGLAFDGPDDPFLPAGAAALDGGRLRLDGSLARTGGPAAFALVAGMQLEGVTLSARVGLGDGGRAALLLAWRTPAEHAFVALAAGEPVTLTVVRDGAAAVPEGCRGEPLGAGELPESSLGAITVELRAGELTVATPARRLLRCQVGDLGRGQVGVGALAGTVFADTITATR